MKDKTIYRLNSYGESANVEITTDKKSLINRVCKHLAKYGQKQTTSLTTETLTRLEIKQMKKGGLLV